MSARGWVIGAVFASVMALIKLERRASRERALVAAVLEAARRGDGAA